MQDLVVTFKGTEVLTAFVGIEATHCIVKPDVAGVERRDAFPTLLHFLDLVFREQVAPCITALHSQIREVVVDCLLFLAEQHQRHLDDLGLAIGIRREITHLRAWFALREVIFLVAGNAFHGETLHIMRRAVLTVTIDDIIGRSVIVLVEHIDMDDLLPHEKFRLQLGHSIFPIFMEHDDVVNVGTVTHVFVGFLVLLAFQALARADEALILVDIQLFVVGGHGHSGDVIKVADFGLALATFTIFLLDVQEIVDGIVHNMVEVVLGLFHFLLDVSQLLIGLLDVELRDFADGLLTEFLHIFARDFAFQQLAIFIETTLDTRKLVIPSLIVLVFQLLIDTLLEENLLQRNPMPAILQLINEDA